MLLDAYTVRQGRNEGLLDEEGVMEIGVGGEDDGAEKGSVVGDEEAGEGSNFLLLLFDIVRPGHSCSPNEARERGDRGRREKERRSENGLSTRLVPEYDPIRLDLDPILTEHFNC